jgi:hypothetical protein
MSQSRSYAIAIVSECQITSIAERHLTLREAAAFIQTYNRLGDDEQAVILAHPIQPIARAISHARSRSRCS